MIVSNATLRKSAEVCGGSFLDLRQPPQILAKSLKTLAEVHCGTVCGGCGGRIAKARKYMDKISGGSAELCVPLKGGFCAKGRTTTPLGDGVIFDAASDDYYTGPYDADLSALDPLDTAAFWAEAQTETVDHMRNRWSHYRGKVPGNLAALIMGVKTNV